MLNPLIGQIVLYITSTKDLHPTPAIAVDVGPEEVYPPFLDLVVFGDLPSGPSEYHKHVAFSATGDRDTWTWLDPPKDKH